MDSLTERAIQNAFFWRLRTHLVVLPNYTPKHWYECDLWAVTKSGYMREWEIKLTVADFKADVRKGRNRFQYQAGRWSFLGPENKHVRLAGHDTKGPRQFWYIMPADMVQLTDIPPWAGMFWVENRRGQIRERLARRAPVLHGTKAGERVIAHARSVCYHRYWRERFKCDVLQKITKR